jgi:nucleoside 2-deoxyribosyltransferase
MKVVVCGSYGDIGSFTRLLKRIQKNYGSENVFPDEDHLEKAKPSIFAHHITIKESEETIDVRSKLMLAYFDRIDKADLVIIMNEKSGREYYGVGTMMELGYALAKSKKICLTKQPTNPNILSLLKMCPNKSELNIWCEHMKWSV